MTTGSGTKNLVVYGTVTRNGTPVRGAEVDLVLTNELQEAGAKDGDTIQMHTADTARTGADGRYAVYLKADDTPTKYFLGGTDRSGLNFDLNVIAGKDFVPWGDTVFPVGTAKVWRSDEDAAPADRAMMVTFDVGTQKLSKWDSDGEVEKSTMAVLHGPGGS
ncbi:MAG: hypothetical protein JWP74_3949 [Marmoricola sp.]|nr:hypothetical protein [Marmoricola sp.]